MTFLLKDVTFYILKESFVANHTRYLVLVQNNDS